MKSNSGKRPTTALPWETAALAFVFLLALFLRLWGLDKNGFGNPYYASAVRSMLMSWHNFFFASFDPTGWVTVDKPPVALWIQSASAWILGYKGFSLIFPQVLEGLGSIYVLYWLVRRSFGPSAALFSALVLALSPVDVAVDRYNNVDACLVLLLLLSASALILAAERSSRNLLVLSMVLAGVAFNTKMMAAFVALPAFYLVYAWGASVPWKRRLADLTIASLALAVVSLSWPLAVDLTPPEQRPFVGSTQENSMIGLSLGWNGFQRLLRGHGRGQGFNRGRGSAAVGRSGELSGKPFPDSKEIGENQAGVPTPGVAPRRQGGRNGNRRFGGMGAGEPGFLRLADKNLAGQVTWFLPLALIGIALAWGKSSPKFILNQVRQSLLLWAGWLFLYALVFSFMRGAMHTYYLVLLAPPIAVLAGVGFREVCSVFQAGNKRLVGLALLLVLLWQAFIVAQFPEWEVFLLPILLAGGAAAIVGFVSLPAGSFNRFRTQLVLVLGTAVFFFCPAFWACTPVVGSGRSVEASPDLLLENEGMGRGQDAGIRQDKLLDFLKSNNRGEKYLLAAQNSQAVASLIIKTGEPMIALGGFMGADPVVTVNEFAEMVREGKIRYFLLQGFGRIEPAGKGNRGGFSGLGFPGMAGRVGLQADIAKWVRDHGAPVDPQLWGGPPIESAQAPIMATGFRRGGAQLFDLRPDEIVPAADPIRPERRHWRKNWNGV